MNNTIYEDIKKVLYKFANSFDLKNWDGLAETLMDEVECDYRDLRANYETMSKIEYVNTRKQALEHLHTQHLFSNMEIIAENYAADCQLSAIIFRQDSDGKHFNSHVIYNFHLIQLQDERWLISKIKQTLLWNVGDPSIHTGVKYSG